MATAGAGGAAIPGAERAPMADSIAASRPASRALAGVTVIAAAAVVPPSSIVAAIVASAVVAARVVPTVAVAEAERPRQPPAQSATVVAIVAEVGPDGGPDVVGRTVRRTVLDVGLVVSRLVVGRASVVGIRCPVRVGVRCVRVARRRPLDEITDDLFAGAGVPEPEDLIGPDHEGELPVLEERDDRPVGYSV